MTPDTKVVAPTPGTLDLKRHLVCGAGGSRAILASAGTIYACEIAGITDWQTLGGISGGSIPTVLLAAGVKPAELLKFAVELDFSSLVPRHATPLHTVIAFLLKDRFEYTRPKKGVLSSEPLGAWLEKTIAERQGRETALWPDKYWTMAVVARTQIVFTGEGVFQYMRNGHRRVLSDKPAPIGIAVRATCAVPGIIDAVPYNGRHLHDGALSWDGQCPVGTVVRHFGASPRDIVACDVGEEVSRWSELIKRFWMIACGGHCVGPEETVNYNGQGVLMMEPRVDSVRSLQFNLTVDMKWQAVLAGFREAVIELSGAGLLTGTRLEEALAICADVERLKRAAIR